MRSELREAVSRDERVLALQKTLEQKQQERQKRKTEKNSMKKNEQVLPLTVKTSLKKVKKLEYNPDVTNFAIITEEMFITVIFLHLMIQAAGS